jgi:hypothetical protein
VALCETFATFADLARTARFAKKVAKGCKGKGTFFFKPQTSNGARVPLDTCAAFANVAHITLVVKVFRYTFPDYRA